MSLSKLIFSIVLEEYVVVSFGGSYHLFCLPLAVAQLDFIFFLELLIDLLRPITSFLDSLMGKSCYFILSNLALSFYY